MKFFTKCVLLMAVPSVFEILLLGIALQTQVAYSNADQRAAQSRAVIREASAVLPAMLRQAANVRGAVITSTPTDIDQPELWSEVDLHLTQLTRMVADNPGQQARVARLQASAQAYRTWTGEIKALIALDERDLLIERFNAPGTRVVLKRFREDLDEFLHEQNAIDARRESDLQASRDWQRWMLIAAVVGSLLAAAVAVTLFMRSFGRRLATLTSNAQRLADNALLADRLPGSDEIARLDEVLHQTSQRLTDADRAAVHSRQELEQRSEQLAIVNENLRQQTQENEMFIYSVSHDLRSPLVNLQGFSKEIMHSCRDLQAAVAQASVGEQERAEFSRIIDKDIGESLHFLQTAVVRTSNIIDALLRLSRAGRVDYQMQAVDLNRIVHRVVDAMHGTIQERRARVTIHQLPPVWADPTAIEQIFGNLIGNAIMYLDPAREGVVEIGVLEVQAHDAPPSALPIANRSDGSPLHVFYVRDNGFGIPVAYLGKVFTAFQRFHGSVAKGEGIGLALVRRAAERHGGQVWVESVEGSGTTFFLALPGVLVDTPAPVHPAQDATAALQS